MRKILLLILLLFPSVGHAALEISEVAWMGSSVSANHEWIELYNNGSEIDVTGWILSDGNNLDIALSGIIAADSYVVLERTSDGSAAGAAFLIYTGALGNGGVTLTLLNENGSVVDQVNGGANWSVIGGDNDTKETAQKTSSGWLTAVATPGAVPSGAVSTKTTAGDAQENSEAETKVETTTNSTKKASSKSSSPAILLTLPDITLQLEVTAPPFVHVNQSVELKVTPSGIGDNLLNSLQYIWNFGDGTIGSSKETIHSFKTPGRYVVVVEGVFKRQHQVARVEIDVLPVTLAVEVLDDKSVAVTNNGDAEIDLSAYRLVGHKAFVFPQYSILLAGQTITIPAIRITPDSNELMIVLYDQSGQAVATLLPAVIARSFAPDVYVNTIQRTEFRTATPVTSPSRISALIDSQVIENSPPTKNDRFAFASADTAQTDSTIIPVALAAGGLGTTSQLAQVAQTAWALPAEWPLYTLIVILILGILSIYLIPSHRRGQD